MDVPETPEEIVKSVTAQTSGNARSVTCVDRSKRFTCVVKKINKHRKRRERKVKE